MKEKITKLEYLYCKKCKEKIPFFNIDENNNIRCFVCNTILDKL